MGLLLDLLRSIDPNRMFLPYGKNFINFSMSASIIRQLNTTRGIRTLKIPSFIGTDNLVNDAINYSLESNYIKKGDKVVCLMGQNEESPEYVNIIKVTTV